jgi:molybdopterin synthase sulfur carrier subunit
MATIVIPALLRKFTKGVERVEVPGRTVRDLVRNLEEKFPDMVGKLVENGDVKPSIAVSIDGEIATGGVIDTVRDDSEVHFIPALGGGA